MKIFELDGHKLILGDALEVLSHEIKDNSIDLIFADPPYNIGKNFDGFKDKWESESDYLEWSYIKSGNIGIIHLSYLPLCSLRSLWLNHSDAAGNDIILG
ncbi:DNA methyltransferase [Microcoleus sp.]|uniref:DNA methyltransferase n=1 Tax=Microcoleus sp. TaxID=44472 RepID=UPI0035255F59